MIIWSVGFGQEIKHLRIKQPKHTSLRLKKKDMKFVTVLLGLCCLDQALGGTHSMKYITTQVFGISGMPQYTTVGMVDESPFVYFDSHIKKMTPKTTWITENVGTDYWDRESQREAGIVPVFANNVQIAMQRFNQSTGVHTWMEMYGCQWNDETGTVDAFDNWGYDGEDFVSFDLKNMRYIATTPEGLITKHKWDNNRGSLASRKQYFTQICPEWLKKYLQYGRSTFERKVAPEVNLLQKDSEVVCHSTGFYPDGIMITWKRDGEEIQEDVTVGETLPNEDGTFQKRAVLTVSPEQRKKGQYTCEVDHKSGPTTVKTLIVEDGNSLGIIIGCVVAAVIVIGVIVAIVVMMKKKDYKKAEQSDSDSDASNAARA